MIEKNIATPAYVFDTIKLAERAGRIKKLLGRHKLCYAIKANPFLTEMLADIVDCLEVCSPGEYRICERAAVPAEKIVLSGVYKEESDLRRIVGQCGVKTTYTVESVSQFELLKKIAGETGLKLPVCLRLSSGNQFGIDRDTLIAAVRERDTSGLDIFGIQYYSGTQKKPEKIKKEAEMLIGLVRELRDSEGFFCRRIEYGPGLGVSYFRSDAPADDDELINMLCGAFDNMPDECEAVFEAGRFLVADCGEYVTTVADLKKTDGINYCIVDGGINHLNYYGQTMAMKLPFIRHIKGGASSADGKPDTYNICGSLCTVADVLVRNCPLTDLAAGDKLVFEKAGAYSVTEGIYLFLSRDMPRIYMRIPGNKLVTVRDVLRTDEINSKQ